MNWMSLYRTRARTPHECLVRGYGGAEGDCCRAVAAWAHTTMPNFFRLVPAISALVFASTAAAQNLNVDVDFRGSPPEIGGGVPSPSFGGPGERPGFWNSLLPFTSSPVPLFDLGGSPTSARVSMTGSGGALGFNNPNISGDFKLLMADAERVSDVLTYNLTGLQPGSYRVFTLAVPPGGEFASTTIRIPGSISGDQTVSGSMQANFFQHLLTHSVHDIVVSDGTLRIQASGVWPNSFVNGFQVAMVPEPGTLLVLTGSLTAWAARRRRRV